MRRSVRDNVEIVGALDMSTLMFGRSIRGILECDSVPHVFTPTLVGLHLQGRFSLDRLASTYAFEDINQAVAEAELGSVLKAVHTFS